MSLKSKGSWELVLGYSIPSPPASGFIDVQGVPQHSRLEVEAPQYYCLESVVNCCSMEWMPVGSTMYSKRAHAATTAANTEANFVAAV